MPATNDKLASLLIEWAELLKLHDADSFRVRAYERAARSIEGVAVDLSTLEAKEIQSLPGIGKGMASRITEFLEHGSISELDDLREQVPAGMRQLLQVPGLGPKKAILLHEELGVASLEDLKTAIKKRKLRTVKGLGVKTEENLARGLEHLERFADRVLIDEAMVLAEHLLSRLRTDLSLSEEHSCFAGSLRRGRETIGDIDLLVACDGEDETAAVMERFTTLPDVKEIIAHGPTKSSVRTFSGMQVDLRVLPKQSWGAGLVYFTGSKEHNIKLRSLALQRGARLNEWGLVDAESGDPIAAATEEDVYAALGLPWIDPTLREDRGEIDAAREGRLPDLITADQLRGDFHSHTDMTDGRASLEVMLESAAARGDEYYTVSDHAEGLPMTGVGREAMLAQRKRIQALQKKYPQMRILHGVELNIGREGDVDYDSNFLAGFDVCVASVHSHFRLSSEETTARVIKAINNPQVHVIGHPSGRLLGRREPITWDFPAICEAAARTGTALEVNCFPDRLDLRDEHVKYAIDHGVTLAIDTDAHSPRDLENRRYGVLTARRGWATAAHVLNARPLEQVLEFVAAKRAR
jgi:DNA polymerase (family X)